MARYVCVGGALFGLCGCMSVSGCVCSVFDGGVHGCVCCKSVRCVHVVFAEDGALCVCMGVQWVWLGVGDAKRRNRQRNS